MSSVRQADLIILDSAGQPKCELHVQLLPKTSEYQKPHPLLDFRLDPSRDDEAEDVQLLEGFEYLYEFSFEDSEHEPSLHIDTDKNDVFQADTKSGMRGRLKTGLYTGSLPVTVFKNGAKVGKVSFEIRSRKLDYKSHYRWMLTDIADALTELIMERFAPTEQQFQLNEELDAATLYQRFAFLQSLITDDLFDASVQQIFARPHHIWAVEEEYRYPGQPVPASSNVARQIGRPGQKVEWGGHPIVSHLPARILVERTENSVDTPPNRFIKFALIRWRSVVSEIGRILSLKAGTIPIERGKREVQIILDKLDALLAEELFREVGPLTHFPAENQVLQKREGYRDLFLAYIQFEAAALLSWDGGEDVYGAGQKDVATLYEYWTYMQLAEIISGLCNITLDFGELLKVTKDNLGVDLKKGSQKVLRGVVDRSGRKLTLEFYFNKTFIREPKSGSWTKQMRPDCSLAIIPDKYSSPDLERVWIHFDAKYRVDNLQQIFGDDLEDDSEVEANEINEAKGPMILGEAKRDDLLKMHAYRDAIKRSAGAYVIYPGEPEKDDNLHREFHEILPGLGAFTLYPTEHGEAHGTNPIRSFINDVIEHIASQLTQHERGRFWLEKSYTQEQRDTKKIDAAPFLKQPAADTIILVGYVKNRKQYDWIADKNLYNMRADKRRGKVEVGAQELTADLLLLYNERENIIELREIVGDPKTMTKGNMDKLGYPVPKSEIYWCLPIGPDIHKMWNKEITFESIDRVRSEDAQDREPKTPFSTTWLDLFGE